MSNVLKMQTPSAAPYKALAGKVALVTGSSSGIGKAIALEMARRGASVVVNYIGKPDAANEVVNSIAGENGSAIALEADVSKQADAAKMITEAVARFGRLDVLVNNAGIEKETPFLEKSEEEWDRVSLAGGRRRATRQVSFKMRDPDLTQCLRGGEHPIREPRKLH